MILTYWGGWYDAQAALFHSDGQGARGRPGQFLSGDTLLRHVHLYQMR